MRYIYIALVSFSIALSSCNNPPADKEAKNTAAAVAGTAPAQSKLHDEGTKKLMALLADYYNLKDAFVASSSVKADSAAGKLAMSADSFKTYIEQKERTDDSTVTLCSQLHPYVDTIISETKNLVATADATCEKKRIPFSKISDQVYLLLKKADIKNGGIYQQHCPMAFDEKGASWLSNEADIKNPYYGKKMLECGDVTDSLK